MKKVTVVTVFGWAGKKTDPADPVREKEGVCRRRDRLCGDGKQEWGKGSAEEQKGNVRDFLGKC